MSQPFAFPRMHECTARFRRSASVSHVGIALAVVAAACADAPTGPQALVIAGRTEAALSVAEPLPTLPRLIDAAIGPDAMPSGPGDALAHAEALWLKARTASREALATELRETAYRLATPTLAARLGPAAMKEAHAALEAWLQAALPVVEHVGSRKLKVALADGRNYLERARAAQHRGDAVTAAEATLRAADRLLATSPPAVCEHLLRVGAAALAAKNGPAANRTEQEQLDLQRAERLLRGAREALEEGDYTRAIHRAYYAVQLLE